MHTRPLVFLCLILPALPGHAQTADPQLPAVTVIAPRPLEAASELRVPGATLNDLPIIRPGEILEAAPGLIVTQHSGEGKANQYFLRGFNLDHGTDLAISVDGMPVNMRTHAHGQGYADLNFLIPELIGSVNIRKGPYFADEGDFSSVGSVHIDLLDSIRNMASVTVGSFGYRRGLGITSTKLGEGTLLVAAFDGIPDFVDLLKKGEIVASGMQQPYLMGVKSGEALVTALKGGKPDKEILVPIVIATSKNIDQILPTIKQTVFANELP